MVIVTATTFQLTETSFPLSRVCVRKELVLLDEVYRRTRVPADVARNRRHVAYIQTVAHTCAAVAHVATLHTTSGEIHKHRVPGASHCGTRYLTEGGWLYLLARA